MRQGIGVVGEKWETRRQLVAVNEKPVRIKVSSVIS
jgi:hypothetical protein